MDAESDDADRPPPRVKGMLGPNTDDTFGRFGDYQPPALRGQIDDFSVADACSVLDGDVTTEESARIVKAVRETVRRGAPLPKRPHGGHRYGTGWGKTEFDPGFTEEDLVDLVRGIVDNPTNVVPDPDLIDAFVLYGTHNGVLVVVHVNPVGSGVPAWYVGSAYPDRLP
jgi:hypothetical protein